MDLVIYNTRTKKKEVFKPIEERKVRMYGCGQTVYHYAHIGNFRAYLTHDLLQRTLKYFGYEVTYAMNVTDVGHLVSDADEGEDKLEKRAAELGTDPLELARHFEELFWQDVDELNIIKATKVRRATEAIKEQQEIISLLLEKDAAYITNQAIYFDVTKAQDYGALSGQSLEEKQEGARDEVVTDTDKRNPADFALWFFLTGRYEHHVLRWPSPWGDGFPGWHLECSAIARLLLGQPFDIHLGGIDHIPVHHTNEIAQSETAFGETFANYWMHNNFVSVDGQKMSKSLGNTYTRQDLLDHGISTMTFRYFTLTAHYRTQHNVTWEALEGAKEAHKKLLDFAYELSINPHDDDSQDVAVYRDAFAKALADDLNTPEALAVMWKMVKDQNINPRRRFETLCLFDEVFGLNIEQSMEKYLNVPGEVKQLAADREAARENKDFVKADELREEILNAGYEVKDTEHGAQLVPVRV